MHLLDISHETRSVSPKAFFPRGIPVYIGLPLGGFCLLFVWVNDSIFIILSISCYSDLY